jgi:hypothetical protein
MSAKLHAWIMRAEQAERRALTLERERDEARAQVLAYEDEIARNTPEDVSLGEHIGYLRGRLCLMDSALGHLLWAIRERPGAVAEAAREAQEAMETLRPDLEQIREGALTEAVGALRSILPYAESRAEDLNDQATEEEEALTVTFDNGQPLPGASLPGASPERAQQARNAAAKAAAVVTAAKRLLGDVR